MNVYVIMNRQLLDIPSTRAIFLNGIARVAKNHDVRFFVSLPTTKKREQLENVSVLTKAIKENPQLSDYSSFFLDLLKNSKTLFKKEEISLIHHFFACYRGLDAFDILALLRSFEGRPFIYGPAEVPHVFLEDDYLLYGLRQGQATSTESSLVTAANNTVIPFAFRKLFIETTRQCDAFIVAYDQAKSLYQKYVPASKIVVIPHGVDVSRFKFSKPPKNQEILFVGNLIKRKGVDYLIKAMSSVTKEYPKAKLRIIGNGYQKESLVNLAKKLGLQQNIIFSQNLSETDLVQAYQNSVLFVQPSLSEGFCHVNLEAMASGRPIVSTITPGSFMVNNGETGFLVPTEDAAALASRISEVLGHYETSVEFGVRARAKAERDFDWSVISEKYFNLYTYVMERN